MGDDPSSGAESSPTVRRSEAVSIGRALACVPRRIAYPSLMVWGNRSGYVVFGIAVCGVFSFGGCSDDDAKGRPQCGPGETRVCVQQGVTEQCSCNSGNSGGTGPQLDGGGGRGGSLAGSGPGGRRWERRSVRRPPDHRRRARQRRIAGQRRLWRHGGRRCRRQRRSARHRTAWFSLCVERRLRRGADLHRRQFLGIERRGPGERALHRELRRRRRGLHAFWGRLSLSELRFAIRPRVVLRPGLHLRTSELEPESEQVQRP